VDRFMLEDIVFRVDLGRLLKVTRVEEGSEDAARINALAGVAQEIARPRALYGVAFINARSEDSVVVEGVKLTSRVLCVNLGEAHRVFPYVATCGMELEDWSRSLDDMLEMYWAGVIKEQALGAAVKSLNSHIQQHHNPGPSAVMNPGSLEDWPLKEQKQLFTLLGDPCRLAGVTLTESFLMVPSKSVSGIRFPTESGFQNCQLCERENCPGRRAQYDPELYNRRYRLASG